MPQAYLNLEPFYSVSLLTLVKGLALLNYLVRILPDTSKVEMALADAKLGPPQKGIWKIQKESQNELQNM